MGMCCFVLATLLSHTFHKCGHQQQRLDRRIAPANIDNKFCKWSTVCSSGICECHAGIPRIGMKLLTDGHIFQLVAITSFVAIHFA